MEHHYCLNCNFQVDNKFCPNCGQKTDTHPITFKHFIFHDLLHGVWHLEKGILFTIKEVITRPGQAALDYINGKRVRYYNVFYLALLVIAVDVLLLHYKHTLLEEFANSVDKKENIATFISRFSKIALFSIVPLLALNAMLFFRRLKLNFAQHLIVGGITLLGMLLISVFYFSFDVLNQLNLLYIFDDIEIFAFLLIPLFPIWSYYNATKKLYSFWGYLWRIILFYALLFIQLSLILAFIITVFLNGNSEVEVML